VVPVASEVEGAVDAMVDDVNDDDGGRDLDSMMGVLVEETVEGAAEDAEREDIDEEVVSIRSRGKGRD